MTLHAGDGVVLPFRARRLKGLNMGQVCYASYARGVCLQSADGGERVKGYADS